MSNSLDYVWVAGDPVRIALVPADLLEMLECTIDGVAVEALNELLDLLREEDNLLDMLRVGEPRAGESTGRTAAEQGTDK